MKTSLFILLSIFFYCNTITAQNPLGTSEEVKHWIKQNFGKGQNPPFSFVYGGKKSDKFITGWQYHAETINTKDTNTEEFVFTYTDKQTGLVVKCLVTCFTDFPAVEWVLKFSNTSGKNTPLIEKANAIDHAFVANKSGGFHLYHAKGSNAERTDFRPAYEKMTIGKDIYMTPDRGRSSDGGAFPFFNIETPDGGIVAAIGWTGKWFADILQSDGKTISLKAGMETMRLILYPKEEIRSPKICLLFWQGADRMVGHNKFRQFVLKHHSRKINGQFAEYPMSGSFDYGDPLPCGEYECLTEEYAIALVKRYQYFKILPEVFWLDAGWYTGCGLKENGQWWRNVGNMTVDKERFPHGLRPIADAVHQAGAKFMVWFEPERVERETELDREHPEWLIKRPNENNRLLDLGNLDARTWLIDHMTNFIKREGIDYYRQDFNMDPFPFWKEKDSPDRIGAAEIKHIEGLYAYWDSLLIRFPNLLIDNCASGGRRLDLETISRSAPLWRTDYQYGEVNGYQCHTYALNFYLPLHGTAIYKTDSYSFRSGLSSAVVMNWEITGRESEPIPAFQKRISDYKNLRPYFYGDYYPLTSDGNYDRNSEWLAYQLNRPQQRDGIILAFRRDESPDESIKVKLSGLEKDIVYEVYYEDYGVKNKMKGHELMDGFNITIPAKPSSLLIRYTAIN